jgi:hypothetical protein
MGKGVDKQIQLFLQDYADGEAIVQRYLKIVNLPSYLTRKEAFHKRGGSHSSKSKIHTIGKRWENLKTVWGNLKTGQEKQP